MENETIEQAPEVEPEQITENNLDDVVQALEDLHTYLVEKEEREDLEKAELQKKNELLLVEEKELAEAEAIELEKKQAAEIEKTQLQEESEEEFRNQLLEMLAGLNEKMLDLNAVTEKSDNAQLVEQMDTLILENREVGLADHVTNVYGLVLIPCVVIVYLLWKAVTSFIRPFI